MLLSPRLAYSPHAALRLTAQQQETRDRVRQRLVDGTYPQEEVDCVCGAAGGLVIAQRDRYGLPVETRLCEACGLLRSSPRMTPEATAQFYKEDYRDLYTGDHDKIGLFERQIESGRALHRLLARLAPPGSRVYEVGCGPGGILLPFAEAGCTVAGADLGADYLELGRTRGVDLVEGDATTLLEHTGEGADLVILSHVLEHFLDLDAELSKLMALLKPGGALFVEVPGVMQIDKAYRGDPLLYLQNAHTYHFTSQTLKYVLARASFHVAFTDENALAIAQRPFDGEAPPPPIRPGDESTRVLRYLARLERNLAHARVA